MRKVFLDDLPKWKTGKHKGFVNWTESIGHSVKFTYEDVNGEIEIIDFNPEERYLSIQYGDIIIDKIFLASFCKCSFGKKFNIGKFNHKYEIGDVIETNSGNIKILNKRRLKKNNNSDYTGKGYEYECLNDHYIGEIDEYQLSIGTGCPVCCNRVIVKGINDIATTHPHLVKYFVNIEDAYIHSYGYDGKVFLKCPDCGYEKEQCMNNLTSYHKRGFICSNCGDGFSYPEKFLNNVLKQLNIKFKTHQLFDWSVGVGENDKKNSLGNKLYDFYIPSLNCIIETHGEQHYEKAFHTMFGGKTLDEEQKNDRLKEKLARDNGVKHYIVIDCRNAEFSWVKNSIIASDLKNIFNLNNIDWIQCGRYASNSYIKMASDLWNQGIESTIDISKILDIDRHTALRYLKQGTLLGFCNYKSNKEIKKEKMFKVCELWNNEIGDIKTISKLLNMDKATIVSYLKEGSELGYCVYNSKEEARNNYLKSIKNKQIKVICTETKQVFESANEVEDKSLEVFGVYLQATSVRNTCTGKFKHYKGFHFEYIN